MSLRIDSTEWISGALVIGETGGGVLAENIPADGESGAGYCYNDLDLPADNGKEICGRITSLPSAGTLYAWEDTSFTFTGAPDGSYAFQYQLYVDGVATGSPATVTLNVGGGSASAPGAALTGTGTLTPGAAAADSTAPGAALTGSGTLTAGDASSSGDASADGAVLTGTGTLTAGAAAADSVAPGAALTGSGGIAAGTASGAAGEGLWLQPATVDRAAATAGAHRRRAIASADIVTAITLEIAE